MSWLQAHESYCAPIPERVTRRTLFFTDTFNGPVLSFPILTLVTSRLVKNSRRRRGKGGRGDGGREEGGRGEGGREAIGFLLQGHGQGQTHTRPNGRDTPRKYLAFPVKKNARNALWAFSVLLFHLKSMPKVYGRFHFDHVTLYTFICFGITFLDKMLI